MTAATRDLHNGGGGYIYGRGCGKEDFQAILFVADWEKALQKK